MWHAIQVFFGFAPNDSNSESYLFWSGIGSDLAYLSILWTGILLYRRNNCGVRWCWRLARHDFTDPGTTMVHHLCRHHHPEHPGKPVTADQIRDRYHLYLGKQRGRG